MSSTVIRVQATGPGREARRSWLRRGESESRAAAVQSEMFPKGQQNLLIKAVASDGWRERKNNLLASLRLTRADDNWIGMSAADLIKELRFGEARRRNNGMFPKGQQSVIEKGTPSWAELVWTEDRG